MNSPSTAHKPSSTFTIQISFARMRILTAVSSASCMTRPKFPSSNATRRQFLEPLPWGRNGSNFAEVFPHFVVSGSRHLGTAQKLVAAIQFVTDDASSIFYDFDAFSFVLRPDEVIQHLTHTNSKAIGRDIPFGNSPYVAYFTGKTEIFSAATALGTVSASHNPQTNWGGPDGVYHPEFHFTRYHLSRS